MWERIVIAVILELIRRRLNGKQKKTFDNVRKFASSDSEVLDQITRSPTFQAETIDTLADTVETLLERYKI